MAFHNEILLLFVLLSLKIIFLTKPLAGYRIFYRLRRIIWHRKWNLKLIIAYMS